MSSHGLIQLAVDAALALTVHYLEPPHRLSDAKLFASGNLRVWTGWKELADADAIKIARYLKLRPEAISEDRFFIKQATESLEKRTRFQWQNHLNNDPDNSAFEAAPGKPRAQLIDELLAELQVKRRNRVRAEIVPGDCERVHLRHQEVDFFVPRSHLPADASAWPFVQQANACPSYCFDKLRLIAMADRLDRSGRLSIPHREVLESFLAEATRYETGESLGQCIPLSAGRVQLFAAPTGSGKSVLARVVALDAAERGIGVALIVPDIKETLKECHELQRCADAAGISVTVTPVNSPATLLERVQEFLSHPPRHDPSGEWTLDLAYDCRLSTYTEDVSIKRGDEPCRLQHLDAAGKKHKVWCPFARECRKFNTFVEATRSTILVVNHFEFLRGRMPIPVRSPNGEETGLPLMELVFRRCPLVLIDEVDQFQERAIGESAKGLQISSGPRSSPLYLLMRALEENNEVSPDVPVERARKQIYLLNWLSGVLADLLNRGVIAWPKREGMIWPGARNDWLAKRLFESLEDASARLEAVFGTDPIIGDEAAESLRQIVGKWVAHQLEGDEHTADLHAQLMTALDNWPRRFLMQPSRSGEVRPRIANDLILRALLSRLEQALNRLRPLLPALEQIPLEHAGTVRDALLGYMPWRPAPAGPLGRRVVGFSFERYGDESGTLHAQAFAGDPHQFVAGLGDETALALVGMRRVVDSRGQSGARRKQTG